MMTKTSVAGLCLIALSLSGITAAAGPLDFLKRVGHSIARSNRQTQSRHRTTQKHAKNSAKTEDVDRTSETTEDEIYATKGSQPGAHRVVNATPAPAPEAAVPRPTHRAATAAAAQAALADLPYGVPVPNRPGFVVSPYSPGGGFVDIQGYASGSPVRDPYSGKIFRVP